MTYRMLRTSEKKMYRGMRKNWFGKKKCDEHEEGHRGTQAKWHPMCTKPQERRGDETLDSYVEDLIQRWRVKGVE